MSLDIYIEPAGKKKAFNIVGEAEIVALKDSLKDALDDVADHLREQASLRAPISDPADKAGGSAAHIPSGALKENPVNQYASRSFGTVVNIPGEAEGFRSVRAPAGTIDPITGRKIGGQFIKGKAFGSQIGHIFYTITTEYPKDPFYAKFVAFGTKGHPPNKAKIMKFFYQGKNYRAKWVRGQSAQPYLAKAAVDTMPYLNARLREVRALAKFL